MLFVLVSTYVVVMVGVAVVEAAFGFARPAAGVHRYVFGPPAGEPATVTELPTQMVVVAGVTVRFGKAVTEIAIVPLSVHPFAAVPVTVYVVFAVGETETLVPESDPGIHVYVTPPLPVSVVGLPEQTVSVDAVAVTFGTALTVTVTVAVFEHPGAFVPVTVYVVVTVGVTVTVAPVSDPGIQLYVEVPEAVSVALCPVQIVVFDVTVTVGCEPTVMVSVCVPVQPFAAVPVAVYVVVDPGETVTGVPLIDPGIQL